MKKKLITAMISLLCVVTLGVGSVIAYFSSHSGPVINTFTVGEVEIDLAETTGDSYQLIPGATVSKDPVVTVLAGSEDCYVYVRLERTSRADEFLTYELEEGWTILGGIDGVYYRHVPHAAVNMKYHVFANDQIMVNNTVTEEKLAQLGEEGCTMTVTAYAIQTQGIESPSDGWYNLLAELEER